MSDIRKFLLRMPVEVYESLKRESAALNTSLNKLIVERLKYGLTTEPKYLQAAERTRAIAAKLPNTFAGCDVPAPSRLPCPTCAGPTIAWGNARRCQDCKANY